MKTDMKIAKTFINLLEKEKIIFSVPFLRRSQFAFTKKYPHFSYTVLSGAEKHVVALENFDIVIKKYRHCTFNEERGVYYRARSRDLAEYFLRAKQLYINGHVYGVQKKIKPYDDVIAAKFDVDPTVDTGFDEYYLELFPERLLSFLEDEGLVDFHTGNWGYTKGGKIMIFDYTV